jgi:hypothetical protein
MANSNFNQLLTTTINNYQKRLTDNIFSGRALTWWLTDKSRMRFEDGGVQIIEPIVYATNSTVASYSDSDAISLTTQTGLSAAAFDWKQLAGSVAITGIDEAKNNGETAILNLVEAKIMQLEESMKEKFNTMFFGDGTGNSNKDWDGLSKLINGNTAGSVGGIDPTTYSYWRSYVDSTATALTQAIMTTAYNTATVGADRPDAIFTTQSLYEKYEATLTSNMRYMDTKMADAGFQNLMFKAAPVTFDTSCSSGNMYFLNSKYLTLVGHKDKWFSQTDFVRREGLDVRYALIFCYGNLTIRNRARHARLTAKT